MSKELEALQILYDKYATDDEFLEDDKLFSTIERGLTVLDMFKNALALKVVPSCPVIATTHNADGSVEVDYRAAYEFVATKNLDTEQKKELTKWVIDNIDEDMIRTWLDKKHMNN